MLGFIHKQSSPTTLVSVSLGSTKIRIPVARMGGKTHGPTLLITAGNDGDEYAGIAASLRIIEEFSYAPFTGTLIVIPIVNIPGFESEMSKNPLDGKFPKHIYPGSPDGGPSERLRYWLSGFTKQSDIWMDLHGGSLTERVNPYVHAWKSNNKKVDRLIHTLLLQIPAHCVVYKDITDQARMLATHGCGYLMCESGAFGKIEKDAVNRHIVWTHSVMNVLGMLKEKSVSVKKQIFTKTIEYVLRKQGIWHATFPENNVVIKGLVLGIVKSLGGTILETIKAKQDGILLWGKEGMRAGKGDVVAGVGYGPYTPRVSW